MRSRRFALAAVGVVMGSALVAPVASIPAASAAPCAAASGSIAVVVDFGDARPASAVCLTATSADDGAAALQARYEALGTVPPRFHSSGLLCAIDGLPADGCGEQKGSTYAYWSYWRGTADGGWVYSNIGPASSQLDPTRVEGWRFQPAGTGSPNDPPPRVSSDPAATCPSQPPDTSTTTATSEPTTTAATGSAAPETSTSTTAAGGATSSTSTTLPSSTSTSTATTSVAAGPVRVTDRDEDGPVWGPLIAGGVLVVLGVSGAVITRRRGAGP